MKTKLILVMLTLLSAQAVSAGEKPGLTLTDRVRLAEAFRIGETLGNRIWTNWDKAPFAVMLVTPENEFLIRHPHPAADFTLIGYDSLLRSDVYFRKSTQRPDFLATFPVGGVPTIVIGQAENTSQKTSTPWVVTMLHEHFHQLQYSQPDYYAAVNNLNLSRGDRTGMWMLNYPFPYFATEVKEQFDNLSRLLAQAIRSKRKEEFEGGMAAYLSARRKFAALLSPDDERYLSFQLWAEGVARYTEYRVAQLAARKYRPGKQFRALKDYRPFNDLAVEIFNHILKELTTLRLDDYQRVAFYPLGAGEALLLDRVHPKWRNRYFADKFSLDKYFNAPA